MRVIFSVEDLEELFSDTLMPEDMLSPSSPVYVELARNGDIIGTNIPEGWSDSVSSLLLDEARKTQRRTVEQQSLEAHERAVQAVEDSRASRANLIAALWEADTGLREAGEGNPWDIDATRARIAEALNGLGENHPGPLAEDIRRALRSLPTCGYRDPTRVCIRLDDDPDRWSVYYADGEEERGGTVVGYADLAKGGTAAALELAEAWTTFLRDREE